MSKLKVQPAGFFVLRTPLLPAQTLLDWSEAGDSPALRARLAEIVDEPHVREALFIASPELEGSIPVWQADPESTRGRKIERALVKYFARMSTRPTPFGLFAGTTTGTVGGATHLELKDLASYETHTRLDMDYLTSLAETLESDTAVRQSIKYKPNSSLYRAAGRIRYAESHTNPSDRSRSHRLVAVEETDYLIDTIERARDGATIDELAQPLCDEEVTIEEAREFIGELIDEQVLVGTLTPAVTGDEPGPRMADVLLSIDPARTSGEVLRETIDRLKRIDSQPLGSPPSEYREIAAALDALPAKVELPRLFQTDMVKPAPGLSVGPMVVHELSKAVGILHRIAPSTEPASHKRFIQDFNDRYGEREMPLLDVLDEESGIGFEASTSPEAEASPLLEGIDLPRGDQQELRFSDQSSYLLERVGDVLAKGGRELVLESEDIDILAGKAPPPLPGGFAVMATIVAKDEAAVDRGEFELLYDGASGPAGGNLLGRFCHADPALYAELAKHLDEEESQDPDAAFAEIVHLPEGRVGNVLLRPLMRDFEIPYLGESGAPADSQIPVQDLLVSVVNGRIVLRSKRLGKRIVPRLTCAHNFSYRSLGVYRFLCSLQHQAVTPGLSWQWGPLQSMPFLPRVRFGKTVFTPARWNLSHRDIRALSSAKDGFEEMKKIRSERNLPDWIVLGDYDNELPVDLRNPLMVDALIQTIKQRNRASLLEMFPSPEELVVSGPEGKFTHEIIVPFSAPSQPSAEFRKAPAGSVRSFDPGSEWLYVKLYAGTSGTDVILRDLVHPWVAGQMEQGDARQWFFIRYGDPAWHLRVRMKGAESLLATAVPNLRTMAAPFVESGALWKIQLDTYEQEVERYGGPDGMEIAEEIFNADSDAVVSLLSQISGDEGADLRWKLALMGADELLNDFSFGPEAKRSIVRSARDGLSSEFQITAQHRKRIGEKFTKHRDELRSLLDDPASWVADTLEQRSTQIFPRAVKLAGLEKHRHLSRPREEIVASLVHMHINRMLRSAHRAQEMLIYHLLDRLYMAESARQ